MNRTVSIALIAFLATGCASTKMSQYQVWAGEPTPQLWNLDASWSFIILNENDGIIRSLTLRFTDSEAETCTSGEWKKVEITGERPARHPNFTGEPAFILTGRAIIIDLTSNLCDSANELRGSVTESGISGIYGTTHPLGGERLGHFFGVQIAATDGA